MTTLSSGSPAGQTVRLVPHLRNLIREYPAGLGIAKEFIQNADDAGATHILFTLDEGSYPTDALPHPNMKTMMGPALHVLSNQLFTETDLEAIQHIGEGSKRQDTAKTGRFGLGFNTAYNVTDYPAFVSGEVVMCFDPLGDAVNPESRSPGWRWTLGELWRSAPDWPIAFALTPDCLCLNETLFRLPLRTREQAAPERISARPFTSEDIQKLFDEVMEAGEALLLFTRHLLALELRIRDHQGKETTLFQVETVNSDVVKQEREKLRLWSLEGEASLTNQPPQESSAGGTCVWQHEFRVKKGPSAVARCWQVGSGLVWDKQGRLLKAAQNMQTIGEKALPLVGVAIRLNPDRPGRVEAVEGRTYCSLPLPDRSPLNFHINGFFDLNASRSQLYHEATAIGNARIRYDWNQALLETALPRLIGEAFQTLVAHPQSSTHVEDFYQLWPALLALDGTPLKPLGEPLYRELTSRRLLLNWSSGTYRWDTAARSRLVAHWSQELKQALIEDGLRQLRPEPPTQVLEGLARISRPLETWTPVALAGWLRQEVPHLNQCPQSSAPLCCLQSVEHVVELVRYIHQGQPVQLAGLPLALQADGRLSTFNGRQRLYLAPPAQRELFPYWPERFLHPRLELEAGLTPFPPVGLVAMTTAHVLEALALRLSPMPKAKGGPWQPEGDHLPNEAWLTKVLSHLASTDFVPLSQHLKSLTLIPDQFSRLCLPGLESSPLFPFQPFTPALKEAFTAFSVPLVSGSHSLMEAVRKFQQIHTALVNPVDGASVIASLATTDAGSDTTLPLPARESLLTWLAQEHERTPYAPEVLLRLKGLVLWPSEDKSRLFAADEPRLYQPTGYHPPEGIGTAHFVWTGPKRRWGKLLEALGVPLLSQARFITDIFIPAYPGLSSEQQRAALHWLMSQDVLEAVHREDGKEAEKKLRRRLAQTALIRDTRGQLSQGVLLLDPDAEEACLIMQEAAHLPDLRFYGGEHKRWLKFFRSLGMRKTLSLGDLERRLKALAVQGRAGVSSELRDEIARLICHVSEHWGQYETPVRDDEDGETHGDTDSRRKEKEEAFKSFTKVLQETAWLPALVDEEMLKKSGHQVVACFVSPPNRLYRPGELYHPKYAHAVASQAPLLDLLTPASLGKHGEQTKEAQGTTPLWSANESFLKALKLADGFPAELLLKHFQCVKAWWLEQENPEHTNDKEEEKRRKAKVDAVSRMAQNVYSELGRQLEAYDEAEKEAREARKEAQRYFRNRYLPEPPQPPALPPDIRPLLTPLRSFECIWHRETERFWSPHLVFAEDVAYMAPLRVRDRAFGRESRTLTFLGRRPVAGPQDWQSFLHELHAQQGSEGLNQAQQKAVGQVLARLMEAEKSSADVLPGTGPGAGGALPLLSEDHRLVLAPQLVIRDAPWWEERLKAAHLQWLAPEIDADFARRRGCVSLAHDFQEHLLEQQSSLQPTLVGLCRDLERRLTSEAFAIALLRILRHEGQGLTELPDVALGLSLKPASKLMTGLVCQRLSLVEPIAVEDVEDFLADAVGTNGDAISVLYLTTPDLETAAFRLAERISRLLADNGPKDHAPLEAILKVEPGRMNNVLDKRKIPALPTAPTLMVEASTTSENAEPDEPSQDGHTDERHHTDRSEPTHIVVRPSSMSGPRKLSESGATSEPGMLPLGSQLAPLHTWSSQPPSGQSAPSTPVSGQSDWGKMPANADVERAGESPLPSQTENWHNGALTHALSQPMRDRERGPGAGEDDGNWPGGGVRSPFRDLGQAEAVFHDVFADQNIEALDTLVNSLSEPGDTTYLSQVLEDVREYRRLGIASHSSAPAVEGEHGAGASAGPRERMPSRLRADAEAPAVEEELHPDWSEDPPPFLQRFFSREGIHDTVERLRQIASTPEIHYPYSRVLRQWERLAAAFPNGIRFQRPERASSTGPVQPPIEPGSTRSTPSASTGRLRSYLEPPETPSKLEDDATRTHRSEQALAFVMEEEQRLGRQVAPATEEGVDLVLSGGDLTEARRVKVVAIAGPWEHRGIRWTARDFFAGAARGEDFHLYVVEHASEPSQRRLYRLANPAERVQEFRLDDGWKRLSWKPSLEPAVGRLLLGADGAILGRITAVRSFESMKRLTIRQEGGDEQTLVFRPGTHRVEA